MMCYLLTRDGKVKRVRRGKRLRRLMEGGQGESAVDSKVHRGGQS
jgi:hypothetical protein